MEQEIHELITEFEARKIEAINHIQMPNTTYWQGKLSEMEYISKKLNELLIQANNYFEVEELFNGKKE